MHKAKNVRLSDIRIGDIIIKENIFSVGELYAVNSLYLVIDIILLYTDIASITLLCGVSWDKHNSPRHIIHPTVDDVLELIHASRKEAANRAVNISVPEIFFPGKVVITTISDKKDNLSII